MAKYQIDNIASPINFQGQDIIWRTLQNAKNLLMCRMGEVPYDRYRGFDPDIFDLPVTSIQTRLIPELDRLMKWEPDVEVDDAEARLLPDGSTYIKVILNVKIAEVGAIDGNKSKKRSVRQSSPTETLQTKWPTDAAASGGTEESQEAAVKSANASIKKIVSRAKQATETAIYGSAGRVLEVINTGGG